MKAIHKNIKDRRKELGLTQAELAKLVGYADCSMITKIEKGLVDLPQNRIEAFSQALGIAPEELTSWTEEKKQPAFRIAWSSRCGSWAGSCCTMQMAM